MTGAAEPKRPEAPPPPAGPGSSIELFRTAPALFVENQGQWQDASVLYAHDGAGTNVAMTAEGIWFQVTRPADEGSGAAEGLSAPMVSFSASFPGSNRVVPRGLQPARTTFNYFVGNRADWRRNVPAYRVVAYEDLYEGIDLHTWGRRDSLKYEFHVAPGADYSRIRVQYEGVEGLSVAGDGSLVVELGEGRGRMVDDAPYIYQVIDGRRVEVAGQFVVLDGSTYGFAVAGDYDPARELIIDPDLDWSTYLGSGDNDVAYGVAADGAGNALVVGQTDGTGWVSGGFDTSYNGDPSDAFVVKLSSSGAHLWSTYLGGGYGDLAADVAVDGSESIFISGATASSGWTSGGYDTDFGGTEGDNTDGFLVKLSSSGGHAWSTYLGGGDDDWAYGVAVDGSNDVLAVGETWSTDQWTWGGYDTSHNGGFADAFAAKLSGSGGHLWSTYLGGSGDDWAEGVGVDGSGYPVLAGGTSSSGETWSGGYDSSFGGSYDGFVARLNPWGDHAWSTYLGGGGDDVAYDAAVDGSGNVVAVGATGSSGWTSGGWDTSYNGGIDGFVIELSGSGDHSWSTYIGGSSDDFVYRACADGLGNVLAAGDTSSSGWASGGWDTSHNGGYDGFVCKLDGSGDHLWSGYLGGSADDYCPAVASDGFGHVLAAGLTKSTGWVSGGFDPTYNGGELDAFAARISDEPVDNLMWGVTVYEALYCREGIEAGAPAGTDWNRVPGELKQVDVGGSRAWGVTSGDRIYFRDGITDLDVGGMSWDWIRPGRLDQISVGPTGVVWGVTDSQGIYCRTGVTESDCTGSGWQKIPGGLKQVAVGPDCVWGVTSGDRVYYRSNVTLANPAGDTWQRVSGVLDQISVGAGGVVWGVTDSQAIYCRTGVTAGQPTGTGWQRVPGQLQQVSVGVNGAWGVNDDDRIYLRRGVSLANPAGDSWQQVPGYLAQVSVGAALPGGCSRDKDQADSTGESGSQETAPGAESATTSEADVTAQSEDAPVTYSGSEGSGSAATDQQSGAAADVSPPEVSITYPTAPDGALTDGVATVEGTARDASRIRSIWVDGVQATPTAENYGTWEATVPLSQGWTAEDENALNDIAVSASDEHGNYASPAESESVLGVGECGPVKDGALLLKHKGALTSGDADTFQFEALAGTGLQIELQAGGDCDLSFEIQLYDPWGEPVALPTEAVTRGDCSLSADLPALPATGLYTLRVLPAEGEGLYSLSVEGDLPRVARNADAALADGQDTDAYAFDALRGSRLALQVSGDGAFLPAVQVLDPAGRPVPLEGCLSCTDDKLMVKGLPLPGDGEPAETGTYTALVSAADGSGGEYRLTLSVQPPEQVTLTLQDALLLDISPETAVPGALLELTVVGAGEDTEVLLDGEPVAPEAARLTDGRGTVQVRLPAALSAGEHTVHFRSGGERSNSLSLRVP